MAESRPRPPAGLGADGRRLWRDVTSGFVLDAHELGILRPACVITDVLGRLSAELAEQPSVMSDPAITRELRMQAATLARLLTSLRLPVSDEDSAPRPQYRGQRGFYALPGGA